MFLAVKSYLPDPHSYLVLIFMPPFEEEGHIALHLSVGRSVCRSVCRSVDQTMSAQYLENLLLDCYDISYVGWL